MSAGVRDATDEDGAAIRRVHEEAFGRPGEAGLVEALPPVISLVAVDDDAVLGHVLLSEVTLDGVMPVLALGPIGVLPASQGRGHGGALMQAAVERARATPYPLIVLVGEPAFYGRFGFAPAEPIGVACPFEGVPAEAWQALQLPRWDPSVRGTVVYPPPWADV